MDIEEIIQIYFENTELKIEALMLLSYYKIGQRKSNPISKRLFKIVHIPISMDSRLPGKFKNRSKVEVSFKYYPKLKDVVFIANPSLQGISESALAVAVESQTVNLQVIGLTKLWTSDEWLANLSTLTLLTRAMIGSKFFAETYIRQHTEEFFTR